MTVSTTCGTPIFQKAVYAVFLLFGGLLPLQSAHSEKLDDLPQQKLVPQFEGTQLLYDRVSETDDYTVLTGEVPPG